MLVLISRKQLLLSASSADQTLRSEATTTGPWSCSHARAGLEREVLVTYLSLWSMLMLVLISREELLVSALSANQTLRSEATTTEPWSCSHARAGLMRDLKRGAPVESLSFWRGLAWFYAREMF